jgi:hypothetical protein
MTKYFLLCFSLLVLNKSDKPAKFSYVEKKLSNHHPSCKNNSNIKEGCFELNYIEITETENKQVADSINKFLKKSLLKSSFFIDYVDSARNTPIDFFNKLIAYKDHFATTDSETYANSFQCIFIAEVEHQTINYVSISGDTNTFIDSAHEYWNTDLATFDLFTGKKITLFDLIEHKNLKEFNQIAEKQFKLYHHLPLDTDLQKEGLDFSDLSPDSSFCVNRNFVLLKDSIKFYYNVGEITPFVLGPVTFVMPYKPIGHLLKDKKYIDNY